MILHVDGDAFFASCEIAQNEALRGKPVITGADRGIALAVSYEAKKYGISRGMTMKEVRELCPQAIVTLSHYDLYRIYSLRMFSIVRRYSHVVEEYSVDECFASLSEYNIKFNFDNEKLEYLEKVEQVARAIKRDLEQDLGMTFSIGVAPTKVLAKVASKWNKPAGFTIITHEKIHEFLSQIQTGKIWGIGPSSSAHLMKYDVRTALDLALKSEKWVEEHLSKPHFEIWYELRGISLFRVHTGTLHKYKSVMKTGTFKPITNDRDILLRELAHNAERACRKLRRHNLAAKEFSFFIKTQEFRYFYQEVKLSGATSIPTDIIREIEKNFHKIYDKQRIYRATGVILRNIVPAQTFQHDIFGEAIERTKLLKLFTTVDVITKKYGNGALHLARSLLHQTHVPVSGSKSNSRLSNIKSYEFSERTGIPCWGEVT